jgi:hypothetical protein
MFRTTSKNNLSNSNKPKRLRRVVFTASLGGSGRNNSPIV